MNRELRLLIVELHRCDDEIEQVEDSFLPPWEQRVRIDELKQERAAIAERIDAHADSPAAVRSIIEAAKHGDAEAARFVVESSMKS